MWNFHNFTSNFIPFLTTFWVDKTMVLCLENCYIISYFYLIIYNDYMRFKNIKLSGIVIVTMFAISYPLLKALTSEGNKLLIFLDALTITSLFLIAFGFLYFLYTSNDFLATRYVFARKVARKEIDFETFAANKAKEKEESFNYPLFLGIFYFIVTYIASYIFY